MLFSRTKTPVAELEEERKTKAYSRLESEREKLIFFAVELSGCFGPEALSKCKAVAEMGGGGPEALRKVYESLSIGVPGQYTQMLEG
jgi:hypothetical protein